MTVVSGADGCKDGWVVITKDCSTEVISWRPARDARDLFYPGSTPQVIAVDIPIGLPDLGPRSCDMEARKLLGPGRSGSVFPAPIRPVLQADSYEEACDIRFKAEGKKMSKQAWGIVKKIADVDSILRQDLDLRLRVHEVHPEVSFFHLDGGQPMKYSKKTPEGKKERRSLLQHEFGRALQAALDDRKALGSGEDDVLDAFAALWTAERIESRTSVLLPDVQETDSYALGMEILA